MRESHCPQATVTLGPRAWSTSGAVSTARGKGAWLAVPLRGTQGHPEVPPRAGHLDPWGRGVPQRGLHCAKEVTEGAQWKEGQSHLMGLSFLRTEDPREEGDRRAEGFDPAMGH